MRNIIPASLIFISIILSACSDDAQQSQVPTTEMAENNSSKKATVKLELLWEAQGFNNPESVIYHESGNTLFVSNVNGSPVEKDGNGYISKILLDGTILRKQWVIGLNAPKGLAIYNDTLYVADIDTLVAIDIPSGTIIRSYQVDDAKFLNDVVASDDGKIFVSDMLLNRIHRLSEDQFNIWLESPELESPNGLYAEGDHLIVGAWGVMTDGFATEVPGHLKSVSLKDRSISNLGGDPIGNLDGVESDGSNGYYVTDWMVGKLYRINKEGDATLLLELEQGMADHEIILEQNLILLPMMKNDKVLAYKIK
jgi:outer membrane protein assembly factor BamB